MTILHPIRNVPALIPSWVGRFHCIGADCEDNCCTGWVVQVDKKTFNTYREVKHPVLSKLFAEKLKRKRSQTTDAAYAEIRMEPGTRECPFMEARLCAIHREFGEDKLSDTCFEYPRSTRQFGEQFEQAMTLSCPEAARQALLASDAFDFVQGTIRVRSSMVSMVQKKQGLPLEVMNEVRIFCLNLMRARELELPFRLAVLGVFCEALTETLAKGNHAAVPSMLESFVAAVQGGQLSEILANMPPDHASQAMAFVMNFLNRTDKQVTAAQDQVWQSVAKGLGIDMKEGSVSVDVLTANYVSGLARLPQALETAPFLLEHYLCNEMFRNLFPFKGATAYEDYVGLVSRFGTLRLMLAARCNAQEVLPDAAGLVQTVQVFCRLLQHDPRFEAQIDAIHKLFAWNRMEQIYRFLRA